MCLPVLQESGKTKTTRLDFSELGLQCSLGFPGQVHLCKTWEEEVGEGCFCCLCSARGSSGDVFVEVPASGHLIFVG